MNYDWNGMMMVNFTADSLWADVSQILQCALKEFVPITVCRNSTSKCALAKYPAQIRAAVKRKQYLWKLHKSHPCDVTISNSYRRLQAECQKLIRDYEIKREERN